MIYQFIILFAYLAKMNSVCDFIAKFAQDTEMNDQYILQYNDEYCGDMDVYIVAYLKKNLGDMIKNIRVITENEKSYVLFSTDYQNYEIYEYTGSHGDDYWVVSIVDRVVEE